MQNGLSFKNTMSRVGLCYFVLMLVTQALQLAGMTLLGSLLETGWGLWALSYAPLYCIAVPVFILLLQKLVPGTPGTAGSAALTAGGWLRWLVLCLGVTYLFNFVSLGITALLGMLKGGAVQNPLALMQMNSSPLATFLFACVLAPVGEEFLFRKLLYDKIGGYGVRTYVLVGAFLFALFHANLSQLLYAFVLGAVFCYIYAHTGKLRYTILLHIAINTIGTMAAPLFHTIRRDLGHGCRGDTGACEHCGGRRDCGAQALAVSRCSTRGRQGRRGGAAPGPQLWPCAAHAGHAGIHRSVRGAYSCGHLFDMSGPFRAKNGK